MIWSVSERFFVLHYTVVCILTNHILISLLKEKPALNKAQNFNQSVLCVSDWLIRTRTGAAGSGDNAQYIFLCITFTRC